jgi:hypothetical protein
MLAFGRYLRYRLWFWFLSLLRLLSLLSLLLRLLLLLWVRFWVWFWFGVVVRPGLQDSDTLQQESVRYLPVRVASL